MRNKNFPFIKQLDSQDCGLACITMIGLSYNKNYSLNDEELLNDKYTKQGISISVLDELAKKQGFNTIAVKLDFVAMVENVVLPGIFFWNQNHFIVVYKIKGDKIYVADPAFGKTVYSKKEFLAGWAEGSNEGVVLVLEPKASLFEQPVKVVQNKVSLNYVVKYLIQHKRQLTLICLTLLVSSGLDLFFPFFTKSIIDKGVNLKDVSFIYLVLFAQIFLFISKIGNEFYRSWLFIHISSRISLSIISDFLVKLMNLPLRFFNSKNIGDLTQRINDHRRIESFLTKDLIQLVFSSISIIIYSGILYYFDVKIFVVLVLCTTIELIWIFSYLEKIRINDYKNFSLQAKDQNKIFELITAIQEIKLNNLEGEKTSQWQNIQKQIYVNNIENLKINQKYESYKFINFLQSILAIFFASIAVMDGRLTVGTMLSIMFILGAINGPINSLISFALNYQLVKVSFERLNAIHNKEDESNPAEITELSEIYDIALKNVSFSYDGKENILKGIDLIIPKKKTTAIVGVSGSGKTSLLKLLLKFYEPQHGHITIGNSHLGLIENTLWRSKCGVILQDSIIFSDTIKYNITLSTSPDIDRMYEALALANIDLFVKSLALQENTIIGAEGIGISQGQKQRLLIARLIYKNPDYLFFDEATNSLDSENESIIVNNINEYCKGKTSIIVAHRLSTVKNADQIIVLDRGEIIEQGNHEELIALRGKYYSLIKNQLELGQ